MEKIRDGLVAFLKDNIHAEITSLETYNGVTIELPDIPDSQIFSWGAVITNLQEYPFIEVLVENESNEQTLNNRYKADFELAIYTGVKGNDIDLIDRQLLRYVLAIKNLFKKSDANNIGGAYNAFFESVSYVYAGQNNNLQAMSEIKVKFKKRG